MNQLRICLAALTLLTFSTVVSAAELETERTEAASAQTAKADRNADSVRDLIEKLDADEFAIREDASAKLRDIGVEAIAPLVDAAAGESREVTIRAIDILKHYTKSEEAALKNDALEGLKKLSTSEDETIALGAKAAIKEANTPVQEKRPVDGPFGGPGRIIFGGGGGVGGAKIEIQAVQIGAGGAQKMTVKNVDGNKQIEVSEKGREITIKESAEGKIEMQITEEKDGKKTTKKYEAKNAEELKNIHPDAHKVFEKYNKVGKFGQIKIAPIRIGPGALPAVPRPLPAIRRPLPGIPRAELPNIEADARINEAMKRLQAAKEQMDAQQKERGNDRTEALEKALEELKKTQADLERQIKEAKGEAGEE